MVTRSRYTRVKELEQKRIQLGTTPQDYSKVKEFIDDKDKDIMALNKRLKAPDAHPVKTSELIVAEHEREELIKQLHESKQQYQEYQDQMKILEAKIINLKVRRSCPHRARKVK